MTDLCHICRQPPLVRDDRMRLTVCLCCEETERARTPQRRPLRPLAFLWELLTCAVRHAR